MRQKCKQILAYKERQAALHTDIHHLYKPRIYGVAVEANMPRKTKTRKK